MTTPPAQTDLSNSLCLDTVREQLERIELRVRQGGQPTQATETKWLAWVLHTAATENRSDVLDYLLEKGCDPDTGAAAHCMKASRQATSTS